MKRTTLYLFAALLIPGLLAFSYYSPLAREHSNATSFDQKVTTMKPYISIFEIPATDLPRAVAFYQAVLDVEIEQMEMPGFALGILPYENREVHGVIAKGEGYVPSAEGPTLYLNAGEDLKPMLDKVEPNGGKILVPKTPHADESGFFALFLDSEGNKMGLHSLH